jgi:hypothetical protein
MSDSLINRVRLFVVAIIMTLYIMPVLPVGAQEEEMPLEEAAPVTEEAAPVEEPAPVERLASTALISVDSPSVGTQWFMNQQVTITGWAADPAGPGTGVSVVYVYLDAPAAQGGTRLPNSDDRYGKARGDVASSFGRSDWTNVGFEVGWQVQGVSPGAHTLYVYAHSIAVNDSSYTTASVTILPASAAPPVTQAAPPPARPTAVPAAVTTNAGNGVVKIESPTASDSITGNTTMTLVAADCSNGQPASAVRIYKDSESGSLLGTANPSSSRDVGTVSWPWQT